MSVRDELMELGPDPDALDTLAVGLGCRADWFDGLVSLGLRLEAGAVWESPAGVVLTTRLVGLRASLLAGRDRFAGAAAAVAAYAVAVRPLVDEVRTLRLRGIEVEDERARLARTVDAVLATDPQGADLPALLARLDAHTVELAALRQRWHRTFVEFEAVEDRCIAQLQALAADGHGDHGAYAAVSAVERWGGRAGLASFAPFGVTQAVGAVGGVAASAAKATRFLLWDEGQGGDVATSLGLSLLGGVGSTLRRSATLGEAGLGLGASARLRLGARTLAGERAADWLADLTSLRKRVNPPLVVSSPGLRGRLLARVERTVGTVSDELWASMGAGRSAERFLLTGWAVTGATSVVKAGVSATHLPDRLTRVQQVLDPEPSPLRAPVPPPPGLPRPAPTAGAQQARGGN